MTIMTVLRTSCCWPLLIVTMATESSLEIASVATTTTSTPCSHNGNVCAGVHGVLPGEPGWIYESAFAVPPFPKALTPHNSTIFYYFNLVSDGQFVPQLIAGAGLCNGTGAPNYLCGPCTVNPANYRRWFMQAQYFWADKPPHLLKGEAAAAAWRAKQVRCTAALKARSGAGSVCYVVVGDLIPVEPGEMINTKFYLDADELTTGMFHASISSSSGKISKIQVPHPYMEHENRWIDPSNPRQVFLGTCMEVGMLINRDYYPPNCPVIKVTVTAPVGTPSGWQLPWTIRQNASKCPFGPQASTVTTEFGERNSISTVQWAWPDSSSVV